MTSPGFSSRPAPKRGQVWFSNINRDPRYYTIVSTDHFNLDPDSPDVLFVRLTLHGPSSRGRLFILPGEAPIAFGIDDHNSYFPSGDRYRVSAAQAHRLCPAPKADILSPTAGYSYVGNLAPWLQSVLDLELRELFCGYQRPLPRARPIRRHPPFQQGDIIDAPAVPNWGPKSVVVSHTNVQSWYTPECVLVAPEVDPNAVDVLRRFDVLQLHTLEVASARPSVPDSLVLAARDDLMAACVLSVGL